MGLFVSLYARQQEIGEEAWTRVFDESLELLKNYPLPLIGLKGEETKWGKRLMFSPVGFRKDDKFGEYWRVEGDSLSGRRAESFILQRHFTDDEKFSPKKYNSSRSILWQDAKDINYFDGDGRTIFHEKTQGYPFHYAMLAVGMLFESRFPRKALVLGDVTVDQVEMVKNWSSTFLKEPLKLPIIMDEVRLWEQLIQDYESDESSAMQRFSTLYHGAFSSMEAFVRVGLGEEALEAFLSNELSNASSLGTTRAFNMVKPLIETLGLSKTMGMLERINKRHPKQEKFDFANFAESLASKFITFDEEAKGVLMKFYPSDSGLRNIDDTLGALFMKMRGFSPPEVFKSKVDCNELLAIFRPLVAESQQLEQKLNEIIAKCEEVLVLARKKKAEAANKNHSDESSASASEPSVGEAETQASYEKFFLREARRQLIVPVSPEKWEQLLGKFREMITKAEAQNAELHELCSNSDRETLMRLLYTQVRESGFAPLENSWGHMENEKVETLKSLLIFTSAFDWKELQMSQLRGYIFDHPELWPFLVKEKNESGKNCSEALALYKGVSSELD